jgi:hypothetical protein
LRQSGGQRLLRVFADQVKHSSEPRIIVRVQIQAENARRQDAVAHLELPQLHVADELLDNDPPADLALRFPNRLGHAGF